MEPEALRKWIRVLADLVVVLAATFMLVFGTTKITEPTRLTIVIGGALGLLGVPSGIRVFQVLKNGNGKNGNGVKTPALAPASDNGGEDLSKEDRWSHMP